MRRGSSPEPAAQTRRRIAVEAARLMTESGLRDYRLAKEKAAARLGIFDTTSLPKNSEIEDALREHQRLFGGDAHARTLARLRASAREALRFFADFEPRLVGAVLDGTADEHSAVCLHLYTDRHVDVVGRLMEHGVAFEEISRRLRLDPNTTREFPALRFDAGDAAIDVTVLPYDLLRQAPLDRVSEKPMRRATLAMLETLVAESGE